LKGSDGFRAVWVWICLIGLVLLLLSSNFGRDRDWNLGEDFLVEVTAPIQAVVRDGVARVEKVWLDYLYLVNLREENRRLRERMETLEREKQRHEEMIAASTRLAELLNLKETLDDPVTGAQVIGVDPTGWFRSVIVNKGKLDGVRVDMPVVSARGVVGRIVSVSPHYAKVLLIIDQNSAVDILVQRSRDRGMVKGMFTEVCRVDYLVSTSDVAVGDVVITSGLGGVFPKGLLVGQVTSVDETPGELFKEVLVKPAVDFSRLEEVLILLREEKFSEWTGKEK
jgi:rod shape-determining protein MreC